MKTRRPQPRRERGVTLVELLVVVFILSLMIGVAGVPASADGPGAALDLATVQVQDAFRVAQALAYSLGTPHGVAFDPQGDRMAVVALDGSLATDPLTHGEYVVDFTRLEQPRGLDIVGASFGATGTAGIFDGAGVPVAGGTVTLGKGGVTTTLTLDPATGRLTGG